MATKENITFQRGMLKSIQTRVTTLASILFFLLYFAPRPSELCQVTCADVTPVRILSSSFPALAFSSLQGRENPPFLIIFLHHTSPPLRSFPRHQQPHPENQSAQEAGLFDPGWGGRRLRDPPPALHSALRPSCSRRYFRNKINRSNCTGVIKIYAFLQFTCPSWESNCYLSYEKKTYPKICTFILLLL